MSSFWEAFGLTPVDPAPLTTECPCCAGGVKGVGYLCQGCEKAMRAGDRYAHPHPLSRAQLDVIAQDPDGVSVVEDVVAIGIDQEDGTPVILAYRKDDDA